MPRGSKALTDARKKEIVDACEKLYKTLSFKAITIKEIGRATSFTRTSIYNYFQTKEEIFLALLQREYDLWCADLSQMLANHDRMTVDQFANALAHTLEKRDQLLKLMSMNHYDMEENSRMENLVEFKRSYGASMQAVTRCVKKFFPKMTDHDVQTFIYAFFPFMFGLYPYTFVTDKQQEAMDAADANYVFFSLYELTCSCVKKLLAGCE
ncbi:MAG: TetR family transcriptional regulator [Eubacterium sp.]|nr:TetR family transcriptional regulator [Eubacterium sp.]